LYWPYWLWAVKFIAAKAIAASAAEEKSVMNLESVVDEIGRMLGGWIRSIKTD
jgi:hypothetical protein